MNGLSRPDRLLASASVLILVAAAATATGSSLQWALLPAAVLLVLGLAQGPSVAQHGTTRSAARGLAVVLGVAAATTTVGAATTGLTGVEPSWLVAVTGAVAVGVAVTITIFGLVVALGGVRWGAGLVFAVAVPVGLLVDLALGRLLPFGSFFLQGASITLVLLGVALLRFGVPGGRPGTEEG